MSIQGTLCEIEQLYLNAENNSAKTVCVTACQSDEGVTSLATALVERYLFAGHRTLLVDLNTFHPNFAPIEPVETTDSLTWIEHTQTKQLFTGVVAPTDEFNQLKLKSPIVNETG
ncbi:hypothetical protein [Vibrio sonorensis]|uniref:hypothetical protein n=1 Tax=Vibrio sonorensis TaxID=1004316 RepID=UPI001FDFA52F|nr:hypothetical protein [Vibrio sonorensis]